MTRKQRRRAWGSITEAKRGKKYILRWQENTPRGRKRKTMTVYGTYREACAELDRIHVERADDKPVPTIAQAYGTWLEPTMAAQVAAGTLAPNTHSLVTRSWPNYVGPAGARCRSTSCAPCTCRNDSWLSPQQRQTLRYSPCARFTEPCRALSCCPSTHLPQL